MPRRESIGNPSLPTFWGSQRDSQGGRVGFRRAAGEAGGSTLSRVPKTNEGVV